MIYNMFGDFGLLITAEPKEHVVNFLVEEIKELKEGEQGEQADSGNN